MKTFSSFHQRGLALVELMIALVLGLLIIGAVAGVMLSNMQGFRTSQGLSQVQESTRFGFELLARDIRQAASVPCGTDIQIVNILKGADANQVPWQFDFANAVRGLAGNETLSGVSNRVAGTEALVLISGDAGGVYVEEYNQNSATISVGSAGSEPNLLSGDIVLICNQSQGTIFQVTQDENKKSGKIVVNTGGKTSPGNSQKVGGGYGRNSVISKVVSRAWYIGDNERPNEGGRSLYLAELGSDSSGDSIVNSYEIAAGVTNLRMRYRLKDTADFITASAVGAQWARVNAIEIQMDIASQDRNIATHAAGQGRLARSFTSVVAIRNRSL